MEIKILRRLVLNHRVVLHVMTRRLLEAWRCLFSALDRARTAASFRSDLVKNCFAPTTG